MKNTEYARSNDGIVHVVNPNGGEHTLCGDAFDIDSEKGEEEHAWKFHKRGPVTCHDCARVVQVCRRVRIRLG